MEIFEWLSIFVLLSGSVSLFWLLPIAFKQKSLTTGFFSASLMMLLGYHLSFLFSFEATGIWFNLFTTICALSGLFSLIRESKPVFARFPLYLVFIPFLIPLFFSLIMNDKVISDLLIATFQGGALFVYLIMSVAGQMKLGNRGKQILGCVILILAFTFHWFISLESYDETAIAEILISISILLISFGLKSQYSNSNDD